MSCLIILPNQLFNLSFESSKLFNKIETVYLIEHPLYFTKYKYHINKLLLHRISMKAYAAKIKTSKYIDCADYTAKIKKICSKYTEIKMFDPTDHDVFKEFLSYSKKYKFTLTIMDSLNFICNLSDLYEFQSNCKSSDGKSSDGKSSNDKSSDGKSSNDKSSDGKSSNDKSSNSNRSFMPFYIYFRKKYNILMDKVNPRGGKWSYDSDNRLKFKSDYKEILSYPLNTKSPDNTQSAKSSTSVAKSPLSKSAAKSSAKSSAKSAAKSSTKSPSKSPGKKANIIDNQQDQTYAYVAKLASLEALAHVNLAPQYLPTDHQAAKRHFDNFVISKLDNFGPYEDAVRSDVIFGYHSIMSPLLNIGLIDPHYMIEKVSNSSAHIESIEGYIRQLFWREYCRYIYLFEFKSLTKNKEYFSNQTKALSPAWFKCTVKTGMENIDTCLAKFARYGYLHHIERLMHMGNYFLLTNVKPDHVFNWFMMFIDAYPWVMYPNVYGMSQFSAGPVMMKRPYFSSSNYIRKLSDYRLLNGWDELYYRFVSMNSSQLSKNYITATSLTHWNKKSDAEKKHILTTANSYIKKYLS
jgi:deoxyribodipyrimidine photolyase-like uncharacterized protein